MRAGLLEDSTCSRAFITSSQHASRTGPAHLTHEGHDEVRIRGSAETKLPPSHRRMRCDAGRRDLVPCCGTCCNDVAHQVGLGTWRLCVWDISACWIEPFKGLPLVRYGIVRYARRELLAVLFGYVGRFLTHSTRAPQGILNILL